ncbi:S8 family serine peptidase [Amycolatopsis sp. GM8]|uniref:S8 family serine peptidase n=1 Tax=Amycolatopsis sp. GM8 TaxID=2896530 RepID=UPI001F00F455|nr:S8 family serine peptidase [Amycolatopsis sp. GM8]
MAAIAAALGLAAPATAAAAQAGDPTANALRQIATLQAIKAGSTKTESKVDSNLLVQEKLQGGKLNASALPALRKNAGSTALVDIRVTKVSGDLITALTKAGAGVRAVSDRYSSIRADVPLAALTAIAARSDVKRVEAADGAMTQREPAVPGTTTPAETKQQKAARIQQELQQAVTAKTQARTQVAASAVTSEGDRAHNADAARQQFGVTGVGVKVCALSDGVDSLAVSQAAGELPAVDVVAGQEGAGDEGTAMLEIIHDLAPGAALGFASAFNSDASFADNIRTLRFERHCDVIVDDVIYFKESPFQDWIIAQSVNDVTADGALYFSSAGNEGSVADGTAAHWEGDFVDSGQRVGKFAGTAHNFAGSSGTQIFEPISDASSAGIPVTLHWSDPLGAASDDYDLYLFDSAGSIVAFSQDVQDGTQDPYEFLATSPFGGSGLRLAIVKYSGANRYLSLSALRGRFSDSADGLKAYNTPGVTVGHSAARDAFSVAAAPAAAAFGRALEPGDPPNPAGPYPGSFSAATKAERFSSDGPRRVFYQADGTPITPGNVSSTGGEVRAKPDLTAADGVSTSVTGFSPFFGTSAAAPHAAAIAALVVSGNPGLSTTDVHEALLNTAVDIEAPGQDNLTGHGILLADKVLAYTGASPQPLVTAQEPSIVPRDGGAGLDPGDVATVRLPVHNDGDGTAVSTSVVLTSPTPGVTIAPRSKSYGTISPGQTGINEFTLTVPATQELGQPVVLDAKVTFAGAYSPSTTSFSVPVGTPSPVVRDFAYTGPPVAIPDNSPIGASVPITVSGVGRASRVTFSVDGTACSTDAASTTVGLNHSYVGDLVGTLTSPTGLSATVFQRNGASGHNMCQVVFDDSASTPITSAFGTAAPFTGTWRPISPLGALTGAPADGMWTFKVADVAGADTGSIRAVSLHINGYVQPTAAASPAGVRPVIVNGPVRPV